MKLSILLQVRNEGTNGILMIKSLNAMVDTPHEILVIYDDPSDTTIPYVKKIKRKFNNVRLIHNQKGRGVINAIRTGIEEARGKYITILATDDTGPTIFVDTMVELMDQGCKLVSATRYAHGGRRLGGSPTGAIISKTANKILNLLTKSSLSDTTTGLKMFSKETFNKLSLQAKPIGWAFILELSLKAQQKKIKLGEVPIAAIDRVYAGKSTFKLGPWFWEYLHWFLWGIQNIDSKKVKKPLIKVPLF